MHGPKKKTLVWNWPAANRNYASPSQPETEEEEKEVQAAVSGDLTPAVNQDQPGDAPSVETAGVQAGDSGAVEAPKVEQAPEADANDMGAREEAETGQEPDEERAGTLKLPFMPPPPLPPTAPPYPYFGLARAYVPVQRYGPTCSPAEALALGTLFPELYRPYPR